MPVAIIVATIAIPVVALWWTGAASMVLPSAEASCGAGDSVELIGVGKDVKSGVAFEARDGCRLHITGGTFRGPIAIRALDRAFVTIEGASLEGADAAVDASGSARVTLTQCSIRARTAVRASDQAVVILEMGQASGSDAALSAQGRARVDVKGAALSGKTLKADLARVNVEQ